MRSTSSVLLAAYARCLVACLHNLRLQRQWQLIKGLKCLHFTPWTTQACNGRVYCCDQTKLKRYISYLLAKSIIGFKFEHWLIEAHLTSLVGTENVRTKDVMEPANICNRQMWIACAKSVWCRWEFVAQLKLPSIIATAIQLIYLKLFSYKQSSSESLKSTQLQ